jgi:hypothetical protein
MTQQGERNDDQAGDDEYVHAALPVLEAAGEGHGDQRGGSDRHDGVAVHAEVLERQRDPDELRHDGEKVEHEQCSNRVGAPEAPEPLEDQPGVPDARDGPQADNHLLVDDHDDDQ